MNIKNLSVNLLFFAFMNSIVFAQTTTSGEISKAQKFVSEMGIGINLGNTMEACGDWINSSSLSNYEKAWGSPIVTKEMIEGYATAGFKTLRVPVAWSNLMSKDGKYTVNPELLNRVHQIAGWAVDAGMYVIVNEHWDGGWWADFPTKKEESMKRYKSIWNSVSKEFKDFGDHVIFESLNEEGGWDSLWNQWRGGDKKASYNLLNEINQTFVDLVRASGGNNATRLLLIAGYNTGIETTCDPLFKMPNDSAKMCAVSVHYYSPSTFAILEEDASWGKNQKTWGTPKDISAVASDMLKMKKNFVDKGIPVIVGEYGCPTKNKDLESTQNYIKSVCLYAYKNNMCPVLWDTPGGRYDRKTFKMADTVAESNFREILKTGRN